MIPVCYKLDSGLKPAGMTTFETFAKGSNIWILLPVNGDPCAMAAVHGLLS
jgi:hypothetical protein